MPSTLQLYLCVIFTALNVPGERSVYGRRGDELRCENTAIYRCCPQACRTVLWRVR